MESYRSFKISKDLKSSRIVPSKIYMSYKYIGCLTYNLQHIFLNDHLGLVCLSLDVFTTSLS